MDECVTSTKSGDSRLNRPSDGARLNPRGFRPGVWTGPESNGSVRPFSVLAVDVVAAEYSFGTLYAGLFLQPWARGLAWEFVYLN